MRKLHSALGSFGVLAAMLGLAVAPAVASAHKAPAEKAPTKHVTAAKVAPLRIEAQVTPHRVAQAPYTYTVSGAVDAPLVCPAGTDNPAYCMRAPCRGEVRITIHLPHGRTIVTEAKVTDACKFSATITIPDRYLRVPKRTRHPGLTIAFEVRYLGNSSLSAKSAPTVFAEAAGLRH